MQTPPFTPKFDADYNGTKIFISRHTKISRYVRLSALPALRRKNCFQNTCKCTGSN